MYKVIVSQKKESTMNHLRVVFKTNPKPFNDATLAYCRPLVGLNENANSFFATMENEWLNKSFVSW